MNELLLNNNIYNEKAAFAKAQAIRVSPQKLNLVAALIRNKKAADASVQLQFCKKKVAHDVRNVLMSAVANAEHNFGLDIDNLYVSRVLVGKAFTMKRYSPRARGRAGKIKKMFSKLTIIVEERG
jgi:large subunit ribosomal protein L22